MNRALSRTDGTTYTAAAFSQLQPEILAELRRDLACPGCGARAFFRHRSHDGRAECFGSHDHDENCAETTPRSASSRSLTSHDALETIHVHVGKNPTGAARHPNPEPAPHDEEPITPAPISPISQRSLRSLLRHLIVDPAFPYCDTNVDATGMPTLPARLFFVRFESINEQHLDEHRGYWGTVISYGLSTTLESKPSDTGSLTPSAGSTRGMQGGHNLWLNTGPPREPSVIIAANQVGEFMHNQHLTQFEDVVGARILVLGHCRRSRNGKLYVKPRTPLHVTLRQT